MSNRSVLVKALDGPLKSAGFAKKADTWYRDTTDVVQLLNLQKSSYGGQFYVNIALWLKPLGEAKYPKEHLCPIRFRWHKLGAEERELSRLLNLEDGSLRDVERESRIAQFVASCVIGFFDSTRSIESIRSRYESSEWLRNYVLQTGKALLDRNSLGPA